MATSDNQPPNRSDKCPIDHSKLSQSEVKSSEKGDKCPIDHSKGVEDKISKNKIFDHTKLSESDEVGKCPIDHTKESRETWLELGKINYQETINPNNQMPNDPQFYQPNQGQTEKLDKARELSTIPKGKDLEGHLYSAESNHGIKDQINEKVWVYPSEQMFFNAMKRKNWDPSEEDMKVIVPIHNAVNERAWSLILKYEDMYKSTCDQPKLVRFEGKAKDFTPKAQLKGLLGYSLPFDRHDWYVDRCGTPVKYIIDFYAGKPNPHLPDIPSFYLDVRPDMSKQGLFDRMNYFFRNLL